MSWPSAMTTTFRPDLQFRPIELLVVLVGDDRAVRKVDLVGRAVDRLDGDFVRLHVDDGADDLELLVGGHRDGRDQRNRRSTSNASPHYNPAIMKRILFAAAAPGLVCPRLRRRKRRRTAKFDAIVALAEAKMREYQRAGRRHRHPRQRRDHDARARRDQRQRAAARHRGNGLSDRLDLEDLRGDDDDAAGRAGQSRSEGAGAKVSARLQGARRERQPRRHDLEPADAYRGMGGTGVGSRARRGHAAQLHRDGDAGPDAGRAARLPRGATTTPASACRAASSKRSPARRSTARSTTWSSRLSA